MDAPLLALTRHRDAPPGAVAESTAAKNMRQLIQLRWLAVLGQFIAILIVHFQLDIRLPLGPMLFTVGSLALINLALQFALPRHRASDLELFLALFLDMAALTVLLFLSGGATNPFIFLYLLQIVLGAILLPQIWVWLLFGATALAYAGLSFTYRPLALPEAQRETLVLAADWISFSMVAILLVLFSVRITRNLRMRDAYLAERDRRAVEEDGIMRMGLFASNAAHELGTPLATLSVLISDWQRHPVLVKDKELVQELEDMSSEVHRCTTIVSDILRSVGQARGESMHRLAVADLLQSVAEDWSRLNPHAQMTVDLSDVSHEQVLAERELRQALFNLLDNAAFVSPSAMTLTAMANADNIMLGVRDEGPGFMPDELERVGKPYHTSKGPGHGLGLFLVSTVARRLGGHMLARNREKLGAEVFISIPRIKDRTARVENPSA